jgi:hypothetical protein
MLPLLRIVALLPMMVAARMRRIERRTIARLTDAGANTAERAILLEHGGAVSNFVYRRLTSAGALVATGNDRYYLSRPGYQTFRGRRRKRALVVLTALAAIVAAMYFLGAFS